MKDQNSITDIETADQKRTRALDIFIESVQKPDHHLRSCAHNQKCYNVLMQIREEVIQYLYSVR